MLFKFKEEGIRVELAYGILDISEDLYHGYKPEHLLVSSIAGSSAQEFTDLLELHHTHVDDFFIRSEVKKSEKDNGRITQIKLHFVVKGRNLNIDKLYRLLESARDKCAIINSVEDSIDIVETLEIVSLN
ncbi:putative OsmC-like protein [Streptohalobacillus salinus]|uniref:Putative OsmC-like protein n=1 Tax=Streptohalobacillus salinus TaxID=621096 RepID=A0A2V3W770_9BACI|nr:OsmC family protein [Streptohalobacillus salinus]PXW88998.1 putative OsmC-like protein [Streptohalobacillus salinus]